MKIVRNKILPLKGYKCVNLFGVLFVREDAELVMADFWHESIHTAQMKEMLYLPFYVWYVVEWLVRLACTRSWKKAYKAVSFEREAYSNEDWDEYLSVRVKFAWRFYLKGN